MVRIYRRMKMEIKRNGVEGYKEMSERKRKDGREGKGQIDVRKWKGKGTMWKGGGNA